MMSALFDRAQSECGAIPAMVEGTGHVSILRQAQDVRELTQDVRGNVPAKVEALDHGRILPKAQHEAAAHAC